jgi:hypothetical protein
MEFRRIAAFIYKRNLKWRKAVALAKTDKLYKDAMETAAQVGGLWGRGALRRPGAVSSEQCWACRRSSVQAARTGACAALLGAGRPA